GGLPMGTTFGLGPVFEWANPTDRVRANIWGIGSIEGFYNAGAAITLPRVTSQRLNFRFEASRHDSPQFDFYGIGAGSLKSARTNYRREYTLGNFMFEWLVVWHLRANWVGEQEFCNLGRVCHFV